eukprot:Partr_v1_DN27377_c0_g1_i1_m46674
MSTAHDFATTIMTFANGVFCGVFLLLAAEAYFVYRLIYRMPGDVSKLNVATDTTKALTQLLAVQKDVKQPTADEAANEKGDDHFIPDHLTWPSNISQFLHSHLTADAKPAELHAFLNVMIHRFFVEARFSHVIKARLKAKLMEKMGAIGGLLSSFTIDDVSMGDSPPVLDSVSMKATDNLDVVIECGFNYEGGLSVRITTLLNIGLKIPVSVQVGNLAGLLQIRVPSPVDPRFYAVAFTSDPGLQLFVESSLWRRDNEMLKDVLNSLIAKRLRSVFVETLVLPNFRSFAMPLISLRATDVEMLRLLNPEIMSESSLAMDLHAASVTQRNTKPTKNLRISTVNPSPYSPGLDPIDGGNPNTSISNAKRKMSISTSQDCLSSKCFPVTSQVTAANVKEYAAMLTSQFLRLANSVEAVEKSQQDAWTSTNWETVRSKKIHQLAAKNHLHGQRSRRSL